MLQVARVRRRCFAQASLLVLAFAAAAPCRGSSHREAPLITEHPKVDGTDFYMFRSYEAGREDFVTIIANYLPLQDPYGGPNYFTLDPDALYEIHIDTNGDGIEDMTFQFRPSVEHKGIALAIGPEGEKKSVSVPLVNVGPIPAGEDDDVFRPQNLNVIETYRLALVRGDRRQGTAEPIVDGETGSEVFPKPVDNIGVKTIRNYPNYAANFIRPITIPGCDTPGRVFVGQRKDPFVVALGETFDLVNLNPLGPPDAQEDDVADKNVTSFVLELPISCLTSDSPIVGAWTTASLRQARVLNPEPSTGADGKKAAEIHGGPWTQVSRLGSPLVNEVVIGLEAKDRFNHSEPKDDAQFADFVTNPTLPALLEVLFGVHAPTAFPRTDLVSAFLTGVADLNQPSGVVPAEMLRLNTSIAPTAKPEQNRLGVLGGDLAGFPNGRRPGDDVVDIELRVAMGVLLSQDVAPDGQLPYTDGAFLDASRFPAEFPYLLSPIPGSIATTR